MSDSRVRGSCLCSAVRFSVRLPSLFCGHCHCSLCRRNHGAGFVTWFGVTPESLTFESGEADLVRFQSTDHGTRSFCSRCGSSLFCVSTRHPERVDIVLANMQGAIDRAPQAHVFYGDRADWVAADDGLPRLGGATGFEPLGAEG